jgi:hypothetical protein
MNCPFYGYTMIAPSVETQVRLNIQLRPMFMSTRGNQCALMTNAHSPCRMEIEGHSPEWYTCPRNPAVQEARQNAPV